MGLRETKNKESQALESEGCAEKSEQQWKEHRGAKGPLPGEDAEEGKDPKTITHGERMQAKIKAKSC